MPNVIKKQEEQMNQSFYYHAMEVEPEVVLSKKKVTHQSFVAFPT